MSVSSGVSDVSQFELSIVLNTVSQMTLLKRNREQMNKVFNWYVKVKIKVTPVQALRLCTDPTAHRGSRGIALPFHDHGTRWCEGSASRPGRSLPPGKIRYLLYRRLGGPQGRSGQVRKISLPTGIRSPGRPARSQSLYRLSYAANFIDKRCVIYTEVTSLVFVTKQGRYVRCQ